LTAYFISGQAADEKMFENLTLPSNIEVRYIHWIEPLKNETLIGYSKRLTQQMDLGKNFVLVGMSLGGIVAVELNKIIHPKQTIIISSIATKDEIRPLFKFFKSTRLYKIVPAGFYKWYPPFLDWYFGAKTKREKALLRFYAKTISKNYMKWAINEVLNWKNEYRPENLFHIHGMADRVLPCKYTHADVKIKDGTHMMVHNRAEEISKILGEKLSMYP